MDAIKVSDVKPGETVRFRTQSGSEYSFTRMPDEDPHFWASGGKIRGMLGGLHDIAIVMLITDVFVRGNQFRFFIEHPGHESMLVTTTPIIQLERDTR